MYEDREQQWYFAQGGKQEGPVPLSLLRQMAVDGRVGPGDLVWTSGMANWLASQMVPALRVAAPGAPVVMPPPLTAVPPAVPGSMPMPMPMGYATAYPPPSNDVGKDPTMRWLMPVGRSGWAIAAGYLGLFSLIIFPAPIALIISIIAIIDIKRHPDRHGMGRAIFGLIMGLLGSFFFVFMVIAMISHIK